MNSEIRFELFKRFYGVILTPVNIKQAAEYSQAAGCGGPGYPVFCETSQESKKMERIAKKLAKRFKAQLAVINQVEKNADWWKFSRGYKKIKSLNSTWKRYRYGIKRDPALVVIKGRKYIVIYDCNDIERQVYEFLHN